MTSLKKAFDILDLFLEIRNDELRLSEIAKATGLKISTARRLLSELVERGYLKQREKRGKYSLGTQFIYFSNIIKQKIAIREVARPHLLKLNKLVNETIVLANWDGKKIYYVEEIHSEHALRIVPTENAATPLYCTGIGKIVLASFTDKEIDDYFNRTTIEAYTPNTITDLKLLKRNLMMVAQEGIAYDDEEYITGIRNVMAVIKDSEGKGMSCVGVLGPSVRLTRTKMTEIAPQVKNCALLISKDLGYRE